MDICVCGACPAEQSSRKYSLVVHFNVAKWGEGYGKKNYQKAFSKCYVCQTNTWKQGDILSNVYKPIVALKDKCLSHWLTCHSFPHCIINSNSIDLVFLHSALTRGSGSLIQERHCICTPGSLNWHEQALWFGQAGIGELRIVWMLKSPLKDTGHWWAQWQQDRQAWDLSHNHAMIRSMTRTDCIWS